MARMIPPYLSDDVRSTGERRIYESLQNDPDAHDWTVIHSLGLDRHVSRVYGEIDFVVLAPGEGVFCLEVKSGRVSRHQGVWCFTDRYGATSTKTVSPFMQAREGMFSLIQAVRAHFGPHHKLSRIMYRYGVMFPDISFDVVDPEHESWEVYDINDRARPVTGYIKRLSAHAHAAVRETSWYDPAESRPTVDDVAKLTAFLRGDFEKVVPLSVMIQEGEKQLLKLTEDQYRCLDQLENNPRCLFEGAAGTGKTLLAAELATREWKRGKRVLFLCFNRLLGTNVRNHLSALRGENRWPVEVGSFHQFLREIITSSSQKDEFLTAHRHADDDFYRCAYPVYALSAIQEGIVKPYDVLIVDEGQDLISPDYLDVLDLLVHGGLSGGRWAMFCDFARQAIFSGTSGEEMLAEIDRRVTRFVRFLLTVNCRNTQPIGEETALMSGFDAPPFLPAHVQGPPVDYRFYSGKEEEREQLSEIVSGLLQQRLSPSFITILSPVSRDRSCISKEISGIPQIEDVNEVNIQGGAKNLTFSTIQAFKGLENSVIMLTDVRDLSSPESRSLLYVGMSRARQRLFLLVDQESRDQYKSAIQRRITRLSHGNESTNH